MANYSDYPKERQDPLDYANDKMVCFFCKRLVKEIGETLEGHDSSCKYRQKKESEK